MKNKTKYDDFTDIVNISQSSVSLPGYGILRSGKKTSIPTQILKTTDFQGFFEKGLIDYAKNVKAPIKTVVKESKPLVYRPKDDAVEPAKKSKKIRKIGEEQIENGTEPGDHGDIRFVDVEGSATDKHEIKFVDIEETERRIAEHPLLSKLPRKSDRDTVNYRDVYKK